MTTVEKVPAELIVDFDVYDPSLAAPVDVMQERVAELAEEFREDCSFPFAILPYSE